MNLNIDYRPRKLADVVGQRHVTDTLHRQMLQNAVGNAYILEGHFGCGKTTTANILAMFANCENPQDGEPCGVCPACRSIIAGTNPDVIDINASKETRKDDVVAAIIDAADYQPMGKKKVFIVDECQSLSAGAWGAMLKLLEEPPEYVQLFFCTTNAEKIPPAIVSRCQKYHFSAIPEGTISAELVKISQTHGFPVSEAVCKKIAHASNGAMRDAKKILNLLVDENDFSDAAVTRLLFGDVSAAHAAVAKGILANDADGIGHAVDLVAKNGETDYVRALRTISRMLTDAMEIKFAPEAKENFTEQYCEWLSPLSEFPLVALAAACDCAFQAQKAVATQNDAVMCKVGLLCNLKPAVPQVDVKKTAPVVDESVRNHLESLIGELTKRVNALETTVKELKERKVPVAAPEPIAPQIVTPITPVAPARTVAPSPVDDEDDDDLVVVARPIEDAAKSSYNKEASMAAMSETDGFAVSLDDFF